MPLYGPNFLLTSTMYPVETGEAVETQPPAFSAVLWGFDENWVDVIPPTFSGTHIQTLFSGAYAGPPEAVDVISPSFSGSHVQTLFPVAFAMPPEDFAQIAAPAFSGAYAQTLFPLAYIIPTEATAITPPLAISGTLV